MRARFLCDQRWTDLSPQAAGRYCGRCDTTVIDLSRLSRAEAKERAQGGVCGRVRFDERGEPIFVEPPRRRMGARALTVIGALAGAACASPAPDPLEPIAAAGDLGEAKRSDAPLLASMRPLPAGSSLREVSPSAQVPVEAALPEPHATPTAAQRELTARKRRSRLPATPAPTHVSGPGPDEWMGDVIF